MLTLRVPSAPALEAQPTMETGARTRARDAAVREPSSIEALGSTCPAAQLWRSGGAPMAMAGIVSAVADPMRPVIGTAMVAPARPTIRVARAMCPKNPTVLRGLPGPGWDSATCPPLGLPPLRGVEASRCRWARLGSGHCNSVPLTRVPRSLSVGQSAYS